METYSQTTIHKKLKATNSQNGEWILQWCRFINEVELTWSQSTKGSTLYLVPNYEPKIEIASYSREAKQQTVKLPVTPLLWPASFLLESPGRASVFIAASVDIIDRKPKQNSEFCDWEELVGRR